MKNKKLISGRLATIEDRDTEEDFLRANIHNAKEMLGKEFVGKSFNDIPHFSVLTGICKSLLILGEKGGLE